MKTLNDLEERYWQEYLHAGPRDMPESPRIEASYAGDRASTDQLLDLYLTGGKIAGSSIAEDFLFNQEPLPRVGNYWILLNSENDPSCILRTDRVVIYKFYDVPEEIARAEGEGDGTLAYWRNAHRNFYEPFLKDWGISHIKDATVVTEFFKVVYKGTIRA